ncbi:MAG: hypothetical protein DMF56_21765 [Acidobacteria bacterium]|nr:MAG: hypothetical protein DMF56_21765 [Acidobacteriota bacterium]
MSDVTSLDDELMTIEAAADAVLANYRDVPPVPPIVYHYTSLAAALKIIETGKLWGSNLRYSNDPSEAEYGKHLLDDVLNQDRHLSLQGLRKGIAELDTYAVSLSADGDLLPQWRAYCRNGRGVAVGVEFDTLRQRQSMILCALYMMKASSESLSKTCFTCFAPHYLLPGSMKYALMLW